MEDIVPYKKEVCIICGDPEADQCLLGGPTVPIIDGLELWLCDKCYEELWDDIEDFADCWVRNRRKAIR